MASMTQIMFPLDSDMHHPYGCKAPCGWVSATRADALGSTRSNWLFEARAMVSSDDGGSIPVAINRHLRASRIRLMQAGHVPRRRAR